MGDNKKRMVAIQKYSRLISSSLIILYNGIKQQKYNKAFKKRPDTSNGKPVIEWIPAAPNWKSGNSKGSDQGQPNTGVS